jgi:hypothetical protein
MKSKYFIRYTYVKSYDEEIQNWGEIFVVDFTDIEDIEELMNIMEKNLYRTSIHDILSITKL